MCNNKINREARIKHKIGMQINYIMQVRTQQKVSMKNYAYQKNSNGTWINKTNYSHSDTINEIILRTLKNENKTFTSDKYQSRTNNNAKWVQQRPT